MNFLQKKSKDSDPQFEGKWSDYKDTITSLKKLNGLIDAHLDITRSYVASCAELSLEIASFFKESDDRIQKRTRAYGQLNAEIERLQLNSVDKLYSQEVRRSFEILWEQDQTIHDAVKERKRLISAEKKAKKNLQAKESEKYQVEEAQRTEKPSKAMFSKRRKSVTEVIAELNDRKNIYESSVQQRENATNLLIKKFDSVQQSRKIGDLISGPVSAIVASHFHLCAETLARLEETRKLFTEHYAFVGTLQEIDSRLLNGLVIQKDVQTSKGFVFGRRLTISTPDVVCDCMAFIREGLKTEGLFRIPGNRTNVEKIQSSYDRNEKDALNTYTDIDIHDVCSTLKYYFNSIPEPLIPYQIYNELESYVESMAGSPPNPERVVAIAKEVGPPRNGLLGMLLNFLHDIAKKKKYNQMTSNNLATCFAPVLLKPIPTPDNTNVASLRSVRNLAATIMITTILIDNARRFGVPTEELVLQHTNISEETKKRVSSQAEIDYQERERKRGIALGQSEDAGQSPQLVVDDTGMTGPPPTPPNKHGHTVPKGMLDNLVNDVKSNLSNPEQMQVTLERTKRHHARIARNTPANLGTSPPGIDFAPAPPPRTLRSSFNNEEGSDNDPQSPSPPGV